jgi:hypothetical protein
MLRLCLLTALEKPASDFEELRNLAEDVRVFIGASPDKAIALKAVVDAYDVVLGIFPTNAGMDLHVVKGAGVLDQIARSQTTGEYSHTAIAFQTREQAIALQHAMTAQLRAVL